MTAESKVLAKALRPFEGVEGYKDETSEPFEVERRRFADLKAGGLVEAADKATLTEDEESDADEADENEGEKSEVKKAREPRNKKAPEAENKAD